MLIGNVSKTKNRQVLKFYKKDNFNGIQILILKKCSVTRVVKYICGFLFLLRVGYLIYSNGAYKQFDLNEYDTKEGVLRGIDRVNNGHLFIYLRIIVYLFLMKSREHPKSLRLSICYS